MTREDKELLLKDICARLPYGVIIKDTYSGHYGKLVKIGLSFCYFVSKLNSNTLDVNHFYVKPYLRPRSSMTEEEVKEFAALENINVFGGDIKIIGVKLSIDAIDWLNTHHFDYRGLIERGLALEAPEGMYN